MKRGNPWRDHGITSHRVLVEDPHPQSLAAGIKLRIQLLLEAFRTKDEYSPYHWLIFRKKYLREVKKLFGSLQCSYCNKNRLKIITKDKNMLATIDHITPVAKGGSMWDESNLTIACYTCNQKKADKMPEEAICILKSPLVVSHTI